MANKVTLKEADGTIIYPQTMVDTTEIYDAAVTSAKIDWSTVADVNYSLTEQATGGTWIDGKPIYKKTFSFTTSSSSQLTNVQHGISNLDVIVNCSGMLRQSSTTRQPSPRVCADNNSAYNIGVGDIDNVQFHFIVGSSVAKGVQAYVTLWYTKTS